jgi:S1-C subfamily serine protease
VEADSIGEITGLRVGDVLIEVAGTVVTAPAEVNAIVAGVAAGTWLPIKVRRGDGIVELTAKFPVTR